LSVVDPASRSPRNAILFVTVVSMIGIALGRSAIVPIVDTLAICYALSIILCLVVLVRRRRLDSRRPVFVVPGGMATILVAMLGASAMVGIALIQPFLATGRIPIEWILLIAWAVVGSVVWRATRHRRETWSIDVPIADAPPDA
jgi:amino acid transporter